MLALDARQRRFVVGWLGTRGKNGARVARAAGYSSHKEADKVQACRLLHNPKILAALKEEADRTLDGTAVLAILGLTDLVGNEDVKVRAAAIDSVLDRTGYGRKTSQDIRVDHTDSRTTAQIMAALQQFAPKMLPVIETTAEEVPADG